MGYILLFLILTILSVALAMKFDKKIEECFILSIGFIILSLFIFGLFGVLQYGFYFILLITTLLLIYEGINYKKIIINRKNILTFGYLSLVLFYIIIIWANYGRLISLWDEFSHWGLTVKNMFEFDKFSNIAKSTALFKDYPPATSLFQYFTLKLFNNFNESSIYVSMYLMMYASIVPLLSKIKSRSIFSILNSLFLMFLIILIPSILYPYVYITLQVDAMLGVLFSAILVSYFLDKTKNKFTLIKLSTLSVILALTKQMGILFVFIAGIIIFIDYCFIENKFSFKFVKNNLKYFLIPIISVVLFSILWKVSLIINHSTTSWNNPIKIID